MASSISCPCRTPVNRQYSRAHAVKSLLQGIQKHQPVVSGKRLPFKSPLFRDMSKILTRSLFRALPRLVTQTAIYQAFYGSLQPSEFSQRLRQSHTAPTPPDSLSNHYTLTVCKRNKPAPGVDINLFQTDNA